MVNVGLIWYLVWSIIPGVVTYLPISGPSYIYFQISETLIQFLCWKIFVKDFLACASLIDSICSLKHNQSNLYLVRSVVCLLPICWEFVEFSVLWNFPQRYLGLCMFDWFDIWSEASSWGVVLCLPFSVQLYVFFLFA